MDTIVSKNTRNTVENSPTGLHNLKVSIKEALRLGLKYKKYSFLIPAILGGTYQTIGLLQVGITYIQYFSATQLVADSIMYSLFLVVLFAILFFSILYTDAAKKWLENRIEKRPKRKHWYTILIVVFTWILVSSILFLIIIIQSHNTPSRSDWMWMVFFAFIFPIVFALPFYGLHLLFKKYVPKIIDPLIPKRAASQSEIKMILGVFCLVAYIMLTIGAYGFLHKPKKLENLKYLNCQLDKEYPKHHKEYIYSNNKFLFYSLENVNSNISYKVFEFKDLFKKCD